MTLSADNRSTLGNLYVDLCFQKQRVIKFRINLLSLHMETTIIVKLMLLVATLIATFFPEVAVAPTVANLLTALNLLYKIWSCRTIILSSQLTE